MHPGRVRAQGIAEALVSELSLYAHVLGFELPAEEVVEPLPIEDLGRPGVAGSRPSRGLLQTPSCATA